MGFGYCGSRRGFGQPKRQAEDTAAAASTRGGLLLLDGLKARPLGVTIRQRRLPRRGFLLPLSKQKDRALKTEPCLSALHVFPVAVPL